MSRSLGEYLSATRHPWACVVFVLPLLVGYELGLRFLGPAPDDLRTGADIWARQVLGHLGLTSPLAAPVLLISALLVWGWCRPWEDLDDPVGTWIGMAVESVTFAILLFGLVQLAVPVLSGVASLIQEPLAQYLEVSSATAPPWSGELIVRFMGAGIYEEAIFRLVLFSALRVLLLLADFPRTWANVAAGIASAILFAVAHHLATGPGSFHAAVFLYRILAGVYFAGLFVQRGFGIAVGAHAGYDVLVGLVLR